ncbi:ABC transporter ATP-binding protein [Streptomyces sp. NRRL F-5755]|uniref:ABC transporter ATP-binding protein n=1 Tax=Streptomyces sp. NRRL F-5755 TaxID=1519475 RepID=UPI0006B0253B|nr:betaine/proline/choline family ABC transporter ATP-binding protein [Streptomyces sp. NRRL F-5755]KOT91343.1 ABC transporter ATP-binding protein [Streptomyces sp. NRRL F-5755]
MIRFESVTKRYPDGTTAVDDLSFEVAEGELVTLVGPSGCGKTTTMKMVNRLIDPTSGRIFVEGRDIATTDPVRLRRRIGYVIQQTGLFPHRTVLDNTATVPHLLGRPRKQSRDRAAELLERVGLDPAVHGPRYPEQLSGGERQRVGVARALAADPPVLLMDEPFGAVDPVVRDRLQKEFLRLQAALHKTVLLVTHDIEEAIRLGDRIAVYGQGRIEQYDTPASVLGAPASPYVAEFVGSDRALKQLVVTGIDPGDLERPPFARLGEPAGRAADRLRAEGARWAVVLDEEGGLHGWVGTEEMSGAPGNVSAHARRMEAWVPVSGSLKDAFSEMLKYDAGWIAVVDGTRFLGVLTPAKLHEALRRTIGADEQGVPREETQVDSVPTD